MTNLDKFEEEAFTCPHEECPYKACSFHRYSLNDLDRYDYCCRYSGAASMFPLIVEDMKKCNMYLDI